MSTFIVQFVSNLNSDDTKLKKPRRPPVGVLPQPSVKRTKPTVGVLPQPIVKRTKPTVGVLPPPTSYTADQCHSMDKDTLLKEWIRITGHTTLGCRHCGGNKHNPKHKPVEEYWMNVIHHHTSKYGLYADMRVPKTCDAQTNNNNKKNPFSNPYYTFLRTCPQFTKSDWIVFEQTHREQLTTIGVNKRYKC